MAPHPCPERHPHRFQGDQAKCTRRRKNSPPTPNGFVGEQAGLGATQNQTPRRRRQPARPPAPQRRQQRDHAGPGTLPGGDLSGGQKREPRPAGQTPDNGQHRSPVPRPTPTGNSGTTANPAIPGCPGAAGPRTRHDPRPSPVSRACPVCPEMPHRHRRQHHHYLGQLLRGRRRFVRRRRRIPMSAVDRSPDPSPPIRARPAIPASNPDVSRPDSPRTAGPPVNSQMGGVSPYPIQAGSERQSPGFPQPGTHRPKQPRRRHDPQHPHHSPARWHAAAGIPGGQTIGGGIAGVASTAKARA